MLLHSKYINKKQVFDKKAKCTFPHMKIHENKLVYYVQLYNIESYNSNVKNLIFIKKRTYIGRPFF